MKQETNLSQFCQALKWNGGTIHQVSSELGKVLSKELTSVNVLLALKSHQVSLLIALYQVKKGI